MPILTDTAHQNLWEDIGSHQHQGHLRQAIMQPMYPQLTEASQLVVFVSLVGRNQARGEIFQRRKFTVVLQEKGVHLGLNRLGDFAVVEVHTQFRA
jgi:hypothetical protein